MDFKINFQDLASYIVPGAVLLFLLYWFLGGFVDISYRFEITSWGTLAVSLILSYILGHLVQALGNFLEPIYEKRWGGKYSDQLLRSDNIYFAPQFKAKLLRTIEAVFFLTLPRSPANDDEKTAQKQIHEQAFHLCHALILQEHAAQQSDIFQGLYGLYRGLLSVGVIGLVVSSFITIKHTVLLSLHLSGFQLPQNDFLVFDKVQLISAALLLVFILVTRPLLTRRLQRFARHYAGAVYRSFFAWCVKKGIVPGNP